MEWKNICIKPQSTLSDAMNAIDVCSKQFVLAVDDGNTLIGTITDGNIRRALLSGAKLNDNISIATNVKPCTVSVNTSSIEALHLMEGNDYNFLPIVDEKNKLYGVWRKADLCGTSILPNAVVIMAGGLGSRLGNLTKNCPKPMLHVRGRPILEIMLEHFLNAGFHKFYFAVNYKAKMIVDYFGDGSRYNCSIKYLHEKKRMGTAGALSLLPKQECSFLVINADILTHMNMRCLLQQHLMKESMATMVVKKLSMQVPYGVINKDDAGKIMGISEKPEFNYCINTGIYALSPLVLSYVSPNQFVDMPDLFKNIMQQGQTAHILEIDEYWLDIGKLDDYNKAQSETY